MEKEKKDEEKVSEIFKVEKKDKKKLKKSPEKIIKVSGTEEKKHSTKNQIKEQNKLLRNIFIVFGIFIFGLVIWSIFSYNDAHFKYDGVEFDLVQEIAPYRTSIPVIYDGKKVPYNFYLRNDPRKLNIDFNGDLNLNIPMKKMVINTSGEINCDGDGIIGIANMVNLYNVVGISSIRDVNATCDSQGRYMLVQIKEGDKSEIKQTGPACYELIVNNCEILKVTEKFMVETFSEINKN
jgi:hypothetical protein